MYSARRPDCAQRWATLSNNVDLPTPGSPASSVTEPGTTPPPSTRSSSPTPVERCRVRSGSIELIGTARPDDPEPRPERRPPPPTALRTATSSTVPHVPHPRQRPTHLAVRCRHSEQRYCERALGTPRKYRAPPTKNRRPGRSGRLWLQSGRHRDEHVGLPGLLENEREVVGEAVADRLVQCDGRPDGIAGPDRARRHAGALGVG